MTQPILPQPQRSPDPLAEAYLAQTEQVSHQPIAVIDLGTNTFHLLIVEFTEYDTFVIKEKYKEPVKLGEGGINEGIIAEAAFHRGIDALKRFRSLIDGRGVTTVLAFGTSALRDAQNGSVFLDAAREEAGIAIRIINGNEEAALIYQGVRNGVVFPAGEDVLLVDIGGGSVEFIVGNHQQAKLLRSTRLGAARLLERIKPSDPMTQAEINNTRRILSELLDGLLEEIREFGVVSIIGSSGTFETLGGLAAYEAKDLLSMQNPNGYTFDRARFKKLHTRIIKSTQAQRLAMAGMDPVRVDMILMGSLLIDYLFEKLPLETITVSTYALKEGILYDYLESRTEGAHSEEERNLREKAVRSMGRKYQFDAGHANQTAKLALQLFDELKPLHGYGPEERELLKYAALLHDIGHFIGRSGHHKHGQYLLMNCTLQGFTSNELLLLGNIVRYHRKSLPSKEHFHFNILFKPHKELVMRLAGILRIADCLDRGHRHLVQQVKLLRDSALTLHLSVRAPENVDIELENARLNTALLSEAFGRSVVIE